MKRGISEIDRNLQEIEFPANVLTGDSHPATKYKRFQVSRKEQLEKLSQVQQLEQQIDKRIFQEKRIHLPLKADFSYVNKTLRLFVRHIYVPGPTEVSITGTNTSSPTDSNFFSPGGSIQSSSMSKGHFLLMIEGITFREGDSSFTHGIQNLLDRISVEVDKGRDYNVFTYEWKELDHPEGSQAQSIVMKIPCDKNCSARIQIFPRNDGQTKYQIKTQALQILLPQLPFEATEEEIYLALINYIATNNLFSERDRRYCRCDEALKEIFGMDSLPISNIRARLLANHLMLAPPVQFDHQFNTNNTEESIEQIMKSNSRLPTSLLYPKLGGRVIDLSITVPDSKPFEYIYRMNRIAQEELHQAVKQRQLLSKAHYLCREILEYDYLTEVLGEIYHDQQELSKHLQELLANYDDQYPISKSLVEYLSRPLSSHLPIASTEYPEAGTLNVFPQPPTVYDLVMNRYVIATTSTTASPASVIRTDDFARHYQQKEAQEGFKFSRPIPTIDSALHPTGGFLDVGNEKLFDPSQPWLLELGKILQLEKPSINNPTNSNSATPGVTTAE